MRAAMVVALAIVFGVSLLNPVADQAPCAPSFLRRYPPDGRHALAGDRAQRRGALADCRRRVPAAFRIRQAGLCRAVTAWLFSESVKRQDMPALELALLMLLFRCASRPAAGHGADDHRGLRLVRLSLPVRLLAAHRALVPGRVLAGLAAAYVTMPHFTSRINRFTGGTADSCKPPWRSAPSAMRAGLGMAWARASPKSRLPDAHNDFVFAASGRGDGHCRLPFPNSDLCLDCLEST